MKRELASGTCRSADLIDLDPEQRVVDPARRNLGKKIRKSAARLGKPVRKAAKKKGAEAESPRP